MSKFLIVNADDFGMCESANKAVFKLFQSGRLYSSTIMMPCEFAGEAVRFSTAHPEYAIGIHLTFTSEWAKYRWKPLTDGKSLLDEYGYMWSSSEEVGAHADIHQVETEIRAQINSALRMGMRPSHIDNHMGSLYGHLTGRLSLLTTTLRVCGEYGYAYRLFTSHDRRICPRGTPYFLYSAATAVTRHLSKKYRVPMPDYLLFPDWTDELRVSYEHYRETMLRLWTDIPDGITETFVHPALESDELKYITARWRDRVWEYELMNDPQTHKYLSEHGVTMISYRELIKMKQQ